MRTVFDLDRGHTQHEGLRVLDGAPVATYVDWARRFILFHGKRHPRALGVDELTQFLTHLAIERNVSTSTQNQAKSALLLLDAQVLKIDLPWLDEVVSARVPRRLPVVLTPSEMRLLFHELHGVTGCSHRCFTALACACLKGYRCS